MKEQEDQLKKALQQLPTYEPKPETWQQIAHFMNFEDNLRQIVPELPEQVPANELWQSIDASIEKTFRYNFRLWWTQWKPYLSAAACVASIWLVWKYHTTTKPKEHISYTEESIPMHVQEKMPDDQPLEQELMAYIEKICLSQQPVCHSQEFTALKEDFEELNEAEKALTATMQQYGATPDMVKYQIRIENLKAETAKALVQMTL